MRSFLKKNISSFLLFFFWNATSLSSQIIFDTLRTVKMTAVADPITENLTIRWTDDPGDNTYQLYKKLPGEDSWGDIILTTGNQDGVYVDEEVVKGALYEYRILKETADSIGYGYLFSVVNQVPVTNTFLVDSCVVGDTQFEYLVRAVKREVTPSGSFTYSNPAS